MRVGILTFHRALNYGAVLQAYALQRALTRLGADCEVIDYRCAALERTYRPLHVHEPTMKGLIATIIYLPIRLSRRAKFASFRRRHLVLSCTTYVRETLSEANSAFDCFVVGSDQVWNPDLTDGDSSYFLDFVDDPLSKVSYAASLGRSSSLQAHAQTYKTMLSDFRAISVRECDSRDYLETLLAREVTWVLDPVLLDRPDHFYAIAKAPTDKTPYIFAYCLHETDLYRYVEHLRRMTGLRVVYVPESIRTRIPGTKVMILSPEEFLGYIRDAAYVVTDSYHVVALSILFGRNFKAQLKHALPELNSRLTSLLRQLELDAQIITEKDYESTALPAMDYKRVSESLKVASTLSMEYLLNALTRGDRK